MEPPKKDDPSENGPQAQQQIAQQNPRSKLRDLKPEKDPMGASEKKVAAPTTLD